MNSLSIVLGVSKKAFGFPTPPGPITVTAPSTILCEKVGLDPRKSPDGNIANALLPAVVCNSNHANSSPWTYQNRRTQLLQTYLLPTKAECSEFNHLGSNLSYCNLDHCLHRCVRSSMWFSSCGGLGRQCSVRALLRETNFTV